MIPPRKDPIEEAFQALSRAREPGAPESARDAIFKAAAEGIHLRAKDVQPSLLSRLRDWLTGPWPYATATAMLAMIAVTVSLRVQTDAEQGVVVADNTSVRDAALGQSGATTEKQSSENVSSAVAERKQEAVVPGEVKSNAPNRPASAKREVAKDAKPVEEQAMSLPRPEGETNATNRAAVSSDSVSRPSPTTRTPAASATTAGQPSQPSQSSQPAPAPAAAAAPIPAPVPQSKSEVKSDTARGTLKKSGESSSAADAMPPAIDAMQGKPHSAPKAERRSMAEGSNADRAGPSPSELLSQLVPRQPRSETQAILNGHGAIAIEAAEAAKAVSGPQAFPDKDSEQVFRLPDGTRITCRFRSLEGGGEEVLVQCRRVP